MKKLHESSDAAEEERRKDAGEPYGTPRIRKGGYACDDHCGIYHVYTGCYFGAWHYPGGRLFSAALIWINVSIRKIPAEYSI